MGKSELSRRKLFLKAFIILCMLLNAVTPQTSDEGLTSCEIEALVRQLANPSQEYEMHAAALRSQLRSLLGRQQLDDYQTIDSDMDPLDADKRSLGSLARNGFLQNGKRYLGSLARSDSLRTQLETKRSIATLAKNGQLPSREPDYNDSTQMNEKRNLGSAARSGYLTGKRNVGSLARDFQLPSNGKRNLASLARYGLPSISPKRNMASLARMGAFPTYKRDVGDAYWSDDSNSGEIIKRNLGALKNSPTHGQREKRDLADNMELADPIFQNPPQDYEELKDMLSHVYNLYYGGNTHEEKRFLGSVARSGWYQYRPTVDKRNLQSLARNGLLRYDNSDYDWPTNDHDSFKQQEEKRHIGSVARSGWLPAFRPIRSGRFSRSGRARSRIVEYYPQQERLRQPIAAVCRRCDDTRTQNTLSWGAPGLQTSWSTPPRLTALHWRSLRRTEPFY